MKQVFTQTCSEVSKYVEEKLYQLLSEFQIHLPIIRELLQQQLCLTAEAAASLTQTFVLHL